MNDALERLKKRSRPTVPSRDASLTPSQASESLDISTSRNQDIQSSAPQDIVEPRSQEFETLDSQQSLKTKQTTLRLEQGMSDRLQDLCRENGICREVLLEAMFEYSEANSDVLQQILAEAKSKNERRQQIANLKRAKSMMERFGQPG
ncbi:hypothetical protein [Leptolyngbya sp. FACHB-671]|uniref:hypothetical protein n=1 Tax=Leptolyngbya sp. FACHB-671 TaxID=2692812 RepID=UPI0018EFDDE8|nr:hypothetical protein [Leptolyngbya sp. FACHB-671]